MDEPTQTRERAQYAVIGVALILGIVIVVLLIGSDRTWAWFALGGPIVAIASAVTRLRRIRATGHPD